MPYRFTSPSTQIEIYIGFDKFENENLIKYAFPGDIWFHVDKFSSAHVYCRTLGEFTFDTLPESLIEEAAELTKSNSIEGCKQSRVCIIYTPADNLLKSGDMDVGTVGYKNDQLVKRTYVDSKNREMLKDFKRQIIEDRDYDFYSEKINYEAGIKNAEKAVKRAERNKQKAEMAEKLKQKKEMDYSHLYQNVQEQQGDVEDFF
ncbi:hypothetical protein SS50377_27468 [Spironucleus salmonicida]|uniref:NFACT RNA-binding domain-containing protein n=1 Tax=Spironucleus salmonicida TaxID=348837 RepID=V6LRP9_9EUKA|nr:hypothetical protein SS50377_27468 [Spironucleus salmonicida]|eukprot:EST46938.1 hypothetical protein SS50377_13095 [Spironucleus salmonicida]